MKINRYFSITLISFLITNITLVYFNTSIIAIGIILSIIFFISSVLKMKNRTTRDYTTKRNKYNYTSKNNEERICSVCGEYNSRDAKFCKTCGKELCKKCSYCGKENNNDAVYCENCGKELR